MLSTFQIRFVVLIVALGHIVDNSLSYSPGREIQCRWNCYVHMADLTALKREMANSTTTNIKLIKLSVQYERLIDDKCPNEKSFNSSESSSKHCQVCLVNNRLFPSMTSNKSSINPSIHIDHKKIHAICTLKPARTTISSPMDYSSRSSAICHLINFENEFESIDYHAEKTDPHGLCTNFTIPDRTNSTRGLQEALNPRVRSTTVLCFFRFLFIVVFRFYSPAFLCLFYPTEILQNGVTHIILEGASPVSLRSLAGNHFYSRKEGIWYKAKTFLLRVFIIPLPFLVSATVSAVDFEHDGPFKILSYSRLFIVSGFCYCFQAFYISFYSKRSMNPMPCSICKFLKLEIISCRQHNLPQLIINHLRIQPLILVRCWRFYKRYLLNYFKMSAARIPSYRCSIDFMIRLVRLISLLLCIPVVAIALLIIASLLAFTGIFFTTPVHALLVVQLGSSTVNSKMSKSLFYLSNLIHTALSNVSWFGACELFHLSACGSLNAFMVGVSQLSLSEEHLPYLAVLYYVWSSYSSFTKTYHELALALYDCYKDSKQTRFQDFSSTSDQLPKLPNNTHDLDNVIAIPEEIFGMACEELSPLREGVCILILKITVIVFSVFIVFSFKSTPLMKTFLTLLVPKIVAIYIDGGWRKKLRAKVMKEKVPKILEKFYSETSMTTE